MEHKFLALGSVVYLKGGILEVMIVSRLPIVDIDSGLTYYDYAGISTLTGLNKDQIVYFNQENIDRILFEGYVSEHEERIQSTLDQWCEQNETIPKGKV